MANSKPSAGTGIPEQRPKPSYQDILANDKIAAPAHMREESRDDFSCEDIPVERYFSKQWHDLEVEKIWRKTWQYACRLEEIPNIGDHVVYNVVNDSLIVVRVAENEIRAYFNACLHRGTMLRTEGGCVRQFQCPFHGFTWSLDGKLSKIPERWDFAHVNDAEFDLPEARVDTWGGFVFINMDPDCESLSSYLEILPAHFKDFELENRYKAVHVAKVMPCNWKLCQEAFLEAYHVRFAHTQVLPYYGDTNTQYDTYPGVRHVNRMLSAHGLPSPTVKNTPAQDTLEAMQRDLPFYQADVTLAEGETARERLTEMAREKISASANRDMSHVADSVALDLIQYSVFPNFVPYGGTGLAAGYRFRPYGDDPERSIMELYYLFQKADDGSHPAPGKMIWLEEDEPWVNAKELGANAVIVDQDTENLKRIQRGLRTTRKPGATLANYQESRIRHFNRTLDAYMSA